MKTTNTTALFLLIGQFGSKTLLTLDEICDAIGRKKETVYKETCTNTFPIPLRKQGKSWMADIRDVAEYLDNCRNASSRFSTGYEK
jgi:predicted DNA-binding transcriptional regulator AlpA